MFDDILTIEEVAHYLRVSPRTVYDWAQKGEIPAGRLGSCWRFRKKDILEWVEHNIPSFKKEQAAKPLNELLTPPRCLILDVPDKESLLRRMLQAYEEHISSEDLGKIREGILKRERLMSTGLSNGLAAPHVRDEHIESAMVSFAHIRPPLDDYKTLDGTPVEYAAMILAGKGGHETHLRLLSEVCARVGDKRTRDKIRKASTNVELYAALLGNDGDRQPRGG